MVGTPQASVATVAIPAMLAMLGLELTKEPFAHLSSLFADQKH